MFYDISIRIASTYTPPAAGGRHIVCLQPADLPGQQRAVTSLLEITPKPDERLNRRDFFGNGQVEIAFRSQLSQVEYHLRSRVERTAPALREDLASLLKDLAPEIATVRSLDRTAPHHFIGPSPRIRLGSELTDYASVRINGEHSAFGVVKALGAALHRDMKFDPGATDVGTPPEAAFAARHGVCQDFTHIMISCLRGVGIPAGYVSGYLRTRAPEGEARLEGADAMHAWVRAWCGLNMGWIEFDPTNDLVVGDDHVVVAYGRDYSDVAPVRGVLRIAGTQSSTQAVDVVPLTPTEN